jgi:hypothetical protein
MVSFNTTEWISSFAAASSEKEIYSLSIQFGKNIPDASTLLSALEESPNTGVFADTLAKYIDSTSHAMLLLYSPIENAKIANALINKNPTASAKIIAPIFDAFSQNAIKLIDELVLKYPDNAVKLSVILATNHPKEASRLIKEVTSIKGKQYSGDMLLKFADTNIKSAETILIALLKNEPSLGKELLTDLIESSTTPFKSSKLFSNLLIQMDGNHFAGYLDGSYLTMGDTLVFTTECINALVDKTDLPVTILVDWALTGLPALQLLKNLERSHTVTNNVGQHLYRFTNVYYSNSIVSGTGWICTWAASGVAPTSFA